MRTADQLALRGKSGGSRKSPSHTSVVHNLPSGAPVAIGQSKSWAVSSATPSPTAPAADVAADAEGEPGAVLPAGVRQQRPLHAGPRYVPRGGAPGAEGQVVPPRHGPCAEGEGGFCAPPLACMHECLRACMCVRTRVCACTCIRACVFFGQSSLAWTFALNRRPMTMLEGVGVTPETNSNT